MAPALSRSGADRRCPAAALRGLRVDHPRANRLPAAPHTLATGHLAPAGLINWRTQLCLRSLRAQDYARAEGDAGPEQLGGGCQWRGTGARRNSGAIHGGFCVVRFRREAFLPCYGLAEATLFVCGGLYGAPDKTFDGPALANN